VTGVLTVGSDGADGSCAVIEPQVGRQCVYAGFQGVGLGVLVTVFETMAFIAGLDSESAFLVEV